MSIVIVIVIISTNSNSNSNSKILVIVILIVIATLWKYANGDANGYIWLVSVISTKEEWLLGSTNNRSVISTIIRFITTKAEWNDMEGH